MTVGVPKWIEVAESLHRYGLTPFRCFCEKAKGLLYIEKLSFADLELVERSIGTCWKHRLFGVEYTENAIRAATNIFLELNTEPEHYYLAWNDGNWPPLLLLSNEPLLEPEEVFHPEEGLVFIIAPVISDEEGEE